MIVVKLDGYNPRAPKEDYPRPWNIGPVETERQFPFYFPELVAYIDASYRTIADRDHRATAGLSMGGFMSFWIAGKYPHLVSSASNFMGSSEFVVGTRHLDVEYRHDEMSGNYDGVRTRLVTGTQGFHPVLSPPHERHLAVHRARSRDAGLRVRPRHAAHGHDARFSHEGFRQAAAEARGLEPHRCLSVLRRVGMERGVRPAAARVHRARECFEIRIPVQRPRVGARRAGNAESETLDHD